ncbi:MAG: hypothetical protein ACNI25_10650 [Halarcobacter sp.]
MNFFKIFLALFIFNIYSFAGVTFYDFWIKDSPYLEGKTNNFDAQFKIKNTGSSSLYIQQVEVTILNSNGSYNSNCWYKNVNKTLYPNSSYSSGIGYCTLNSTGDFKVVAKVKYGNNYYDSPTKHSITVTAPVNNAPTIEKSGTQPTTVEVGKPIAFALRAKDSDGNLSSVDFDWNDGSSNEVVGKSAAGTYENLVFSRTFNKTGNFTASATAYDKDGAKSGRIQFSFSVTAPVNNAPTIEKSGTQPTTVEVGKPIAFALRAKDSDGNLSSVDFDWNDGSSNEVVGKSAAGTYENLVFSRTFNKTGNFTASATAYDKDGAKSGRIQFSFSVTAPVNNAPTIEKSGTQPTTVEVGKPIAFALRAKDSDGNLSSVDFDWNDGSSNEVVGKSAAGTYENLVFSRTFNKTGNFTASATAYDKDGAKSGRIQFSFSVTAPVNNAPTIEKSGTQPTTVEVGKPIAFALRAKDSDGNLSSVDFDWNDGSSNEVVGKSVAGTYENLVFSRTFNKTGNFTASATAYDKDGAKSGRIQFSFSVTAPVNNAPTIEKSGTQPTTVEVGKPIAFALRAKDSDGNLSNVDFDWNDGSSNEVVGKSAAGTYENLVFSRTFNKTGNFTASATAYDKDGAKSGRIQFSFSVTAPVNNAPTHISTTITPTQIIEAEDINIKTIFNDVDGDFIVNVKVRYKNINSLSWTELNLSHLSTESNNEIFTGTISGGLVSGEYELQVQASDKENLTDSDVLHTTDWIAVNSFIVKEKGNNIPEIIHISTSGTSTSNSIKTNEETLTVTLKIKDIDGNIDRLEFDFDKDYDLTEDNEKQNFFFNTTDKEITQTISFQYTDDYLENCPNLSGQLYSDILYDGTCWKNHKRWKAIVYDKKGNSTTLIQEGDATHIYSSDGLEKYQLEKKNKEKNVKVEELEKNKKNYDDYISSLLENIDKTLKENDPKLGKFEEQEQIFELSKGGDIISSKLRITYVGREDENDTSNYPANVVLSIKRKDTPIYIGNKEFNSIAYNLEHLKAILDLSNKYIYDEIFFKNICSKDDNQVIGVCQAVELESIITEESVKDIASAISDKMGSSVSEISKATRDGVLKATKEIVSSYAETPQDLANAATIVFGFTKDLIKNPKETINNSIDKVNETAEILGMFKDELLEVIPNLSDIISHFTPVEKAFFTAYITTHVAHELAPTSKLKLAKLAKTDKIKRAKWLRISKLLQISKELGYKIKYSYLINFNDKDFDVIDRILTRKYENNPLTKSEHVILSLLEKDRKSEWRPWLLNMWYGNVFNDKRRDNFDYNEVYILGKNGDYYRLDSFNTKKQPKGIFSRKDTQMSEQPEQAIKYLDEFAEKYPSGAQIANVPSSQKMGITGTLKGQMYLEVPVQNNSIPQNILDHAKDLKIKIRDIDGKIY